MNDKITGGRARWRVRPHRAVLPIAMASVAVALLATGCSTNPNPSVASTTGTTAYQQDVAFSACMRSHGVPNFPDPKSGGGFGAIDANALGVSQSAVQKAQSSCEHLLPNGGRRTPAQQQEVIQGALKFAQCMRDHGIPNYPDPKVVDGKVTFQLNLGKAFNPQSSLFQNADNACQKDLASVGGQPG
jgi:hypothetical protein